MDVVLECPRCQGTDFTLEMTGYAWFNVQLDTDKGLQPIQNARIEGDSDIGDDWEPSDMGWTCDHCGIWLTDLKDVDERTIKDLNQALDEFNELMQMNGFPERQVNYLLNAVIQIEGDD